MAVRFEGVSTDIGLNGDFYRAAGGEYSAFDIAESKHPWCDLIVAPCPTVYIRYAAITSVDNDVLYDQLVMLGLDFDNRATVVAVDKGYFKRRFFRFDFTFNTAQTVPFRLLPCALFGLLPFLPEYFFAGRAAGSQGGGECGNKDESFGPFSSCLRMFGFSIFRAV